MIIGRNLWSFLILDNSHKFIKFIEDNLEKNIFHVESKFQFRIIYKHEFSSSGHFRLVQL